MNLQYIKQRWHSMPWPTLLAWLTVPFELNPIFQFYKSWVLGDMVQVSPMMFLIICIIGAVWLAYGYSIRSWPLVAGNIFKLLSSSSVLFLYFWFK
jgi:uncharacterized protein with PQ loop repeat